MHAFVVQYSKKVKGDWSLGRVPCQGDALKWLKRAKPSAPGWDGIPYSAWRFGNVRAHSVLDNAVQCQILGERHHEVLS